MKILDLLKNVNYIKIEGKNREIKNLYYNHQEVTKDSMFFCIQGSKTDGHNFAQSAVDNGATALIVSREVDVNGDITKIYVEDTREAMALISANYYNNPTNKMDIIGITGTNGKTTSTFMMKSILDKAKFSTGLIGTIYNIYGNTIEESKRTTPESMDLQKIFSKMNENSLNSCVMEVSSHSLELKRTYGLNFKVGIFTNLTQDHLDFHMNMENYFKAKLRLFDKCEYAVINADDEYGKKALKLISNKILTFGIENSADVMAKNISINEGGTKFILCYNGIEKEINIHLPGKFNVYNALGCAAAALAMGLSFDVIKDGLESLENVPGRSEKILSKRGYTVVIDYAHTPDGIINILRSAREYTQGRLVIVFGCGGDRDKTKRPIMGEAAGELADFCVVTSDNPRSEDPHAIIQDILPGVEKTRCPYIVIEDRKQAIKYAMDNGSKGDVIVIAGKGHETYQILKDKTIHFDEREIVNDFLKEELQ